MFTRHVLDHKDGPVAETDHPFSCAAREQIRVVVSCRIPDDDEICCAGNRLSNDCVERTAGDNDALDG